MKRSLAVLLMIGLLAGALAVPADAKKKKKRKKPKRIERVVTGDYAAPGGAGGAGVSLGTGAGNVGGVTFPVGLGEKYLKIEIADASGQNVYAEVGQDLDGDNFADNSAPVCGASDGFFPIEEGYEVIVFIWEGPCEDNSPAVATQGTITATFSNMP